jgi:hypothetical protein
MVSEIPDLQSRDQGMKITIPIPEEEDNLNIFIQKTATICGCFLYKLFTNFALLIREL